MEVKNIYQRLNQAVSEVESIRNVVNQAVVSQNFVKVLHLEITKAGIAMIPVVVELRHNGQKSIVKMEISFVNIDNPNDKVQVQYFGYGEGSHDSGISRATTRAVNSALLKIFCLETFDDLESNPSAVLLNDTQKISQEQLEHILELGRDNPRKLERILKLLQVQDIAEIQKLNYAEIIASFRRDARHR